MLWNNGLESNFKLNKATFYITYIILCEYTYIDDGNVIIDVEALKEDGHKKVNQIVALLVNERYAKRVVDEHSIGIDNGLKESYFFESLKSRRRVRKSLKVKETIPNEVYELVKNHEDNGERLGSTDSRKAIEQIEKYFNKYVTNVGKMNSIHLLHLMDLLLYLKEFWITYPSFHKYQNKHKEKAVAKTCVDKVNSKEVFYNVINFVYNFEPKKSGTFDVCNIYSFAYTGHKYTNTKVKNNTPKYTDNDEL